MHDESKKLYDRALGSMAGGVSSQIRTLEPAEHPLFFESAQGSHMWDVDGNEYIDYVMGLGPALFGHAPEFIAHRVTESMQHGFVYAAQHVCELEVAELALAMIPMRDATVRFASSGTEIVQVALRLMRAYSGKPKYVKFEGHYHGWTDNVSYSVHPGLNEAGSEQTPTAVPESAGLDPTGAANVVVCEWNDLDRLEQAFAEHPGEIGGVLMEPILANSNSVMPHPGYLEGVKALCRREGALLCFDEVITGFRVAAGGAQEMLGVNADLATYAKALAGGFPLAMLAGRRELMNLVGNGHVAHGGCFNANVMSIAAARATLEHLRDAGPAFYYELNDRGQQLMEGLRRVAAECDSNLHVQGPGSFFGISFTDREQITNWRDNLRHCDDAKYKRFAWAMLREGVRLSCTGRVHMATSHTDLDIERTLAAAHKVLPTLRHLPGDDL